MSLPELETVARLGLRMVIVIYNDSAYGAEVHHFGPEGHALDIVTNQRLTPQEWTNVVQTMSVKGAAATPAELNVIQSYLANAFPRAGSQNKK